MKAFRIIGFIFSIILCFFAFTFQVTLHTVIGFGVFAKDDVIIEVSNNIDVTTMLEDENSNKTELYYELVDIFDDKINDLNMIDKVLYSESFNDLMKDILTNEVLSIVSDEKKKDTSLIIDNNLDNILNEINPNYDIMERSIIRSALIDAGDSISDFASLESRELIETYKTLFEMININIIVVVIAVMLVVISLLNWNIYKGLSFTGITTAISSLVVILLSKFFGNITLGDFGMQDIETYEIFKPIFSEISSVLMKNGTQFLIVGLVMAGLSYIINRTRKIS